MMALIASRFPPISRTVAGLVLISASVLVGMASFGHGILAQEHGGVRLFLIDASQMNPTVAALLGIESRGQNQIGSLLGRMLQLNNGGHRLARQRLTCPSSGWTEFKGTCYISVKTPSKLSIHEALASCQKSHPGASLAAIENKEVNDFLARLAPIGENRWIGAFWDGFPKTGKFVWMRKGLPMSYNNFQTSLYGYQDRWPEATLANFAAFGNPTTIALQSDGSWMGWFEMYNKFDGHICEYKPGADYQAPNIRQWDGF